MRKSGTGIFHSDGFQGRVSSSVPQCFSTLPLFETERVLQIKGLGLIEN